MLLLIPDEQDCVPLLPHFHLEFLTHSLGPVGVLAHMTPESDDLPVDDRLSVTIAARGQTAILILESPRNHLEVGLRRAWIIEETLPR